MSADSRATEQETEAPQNDASSSEEETGSAEDLPPPYDARAVGRVAARVSIEAVELVGLHFHRDDDAPLSHPNPPIDPEFTANTEWELSQDKATLGCRISFRASPDPERWTVVATYRLMYTLTDHAALSEHDFEQFAYWNAVFNAWPYWRELLNSVMGRAGMHPMTAPVLGVPRADT